MKKIIELAESYLVGTRILTLEGDYYKCGVGYELAKAIEHRRKLEQTPITEDWLKEHGFILEGDGYVFYDDTKGSHDQYYVLVQLRHNKKETRRIEIRTMWRSFYSEQGIYNVSYLLDACSLCGFNLED